MGILIKEKVFGDFINRVAKDQVHSRSKKVTEARSFSNSGNCFELFPLRTYFFRNTNCQEKRPAS